MITTIETINGNAAIQTSDCATTVHVLVIFLETALKVTAFLEGVAAIVVVEAAPVATAEVLEEEAEALAFTEEDTMIEGTTTSMIWKRLSIHLPSSKHYHCPL